MRCCWRRGNFIHGEWQNVQAVLAIIIVLGMAIIGQIIGVIYLDGFLTFIGGLVGLVLGAIIAGKIVSG